MWWRRVPMYLVRACLAQLSRLQAEESMRAATSTAAGSGSLKPHAQRDIWREWERAAGRQAKRAIVPTREQLAMFGFALIEVPPKGAAGG